MRGICRVIIASVLSLGVPPETWIVHSLVGLVELVLLGCSGYFFLFVLSERGSRCLSAKKRGGCCWLSMRS